MNVKLLTPEQAEQLNGVEYMSDCAFFPIEDGNEPPNIIISLEETIQCTNPDFQWVKDLPEIEWVEPEQAPINNEP